MKNSNQEQSKKRLSIFSERLDDLISDRKMTAKQISLETGITESSLSSYRNNKGCPGADVVIKLAKYFQVSADYLLGLTSIKSPSAAVQIICKKTGLTESFVKYVIALREAEQCNYMFALNRLLDVDKLASLLPKLQQLSICKEQVHSYTNSCERLINTAPRKPSGEIDFFHLAGAHKMYQIPDNMVNFYNELRKWRFEIAEDFSRTIDELYELDETNDAVNAAADLIGKHLFRGKDDLFYGEK